MVLLVVVAEAVARVQASKISQELESHKDQEFKVTFDYLVNLGLSWAVSISK